MFQLHENNGLCYFKSSIFDKSGMVRHAFTTRKGGVSKNEFESLNLRFHSGDMRENVLENYKIICGEIGVDYRNLVLSKQVHEARVERIYKEDMGNGITKPQKFESADALMTNIPGVPLAVFSADCVPVILLDTKNRAIALVHSGWRGTVLRICEKTVLKMEEEFSSKPEDIIAAIGPSIRVCHFEVGDDVAEIFKNEFSDDVLEKHEKYHVNMQKAVYKTLSDCGVKRIDDSMICTCCRPDLFYSHRIMGNERGVMAAVMELI